MFFSLVQAYLEIQKEVIHKSWAVSSIILQMATIRQNFMESSCHWWWEKTILMFMLMHMWSLLWLNYLAHTCWLFASIIQMFWFSFCRCSTIGWKMPLAVICHGCNMPWLEYAIHVICWFCTTDKIIQLKWFRLYITMICFWHISMFV